MTAYESLLKSMFKGVGIDQHPQYAVVVDSPEHGTGVYSWHISKEQALHNARIICGVVTPVHYKDGNLVTPSLAMAYMERRYGGTHA